MFETVRVHELRRGERILVPDPQQPWKDLSRIVILKEHIKDGFRLIFNDGWAQDYTLSTIFMVWRKPGTIVQPKTRFNRKDPL